MVKLGLYDDALPWLEEARRALPKDPAPAVELGLAQIGLNNQVRVDLKGWGLGSEWTSRVGV